MMLLVFIGMVTTLQGLEETPLTYVDTPEALHSLAAALSAVREIAVDLEAHSYRCSLSCPAGLACSQKKLISLVGLYLMLTTFTAFLECDVSAGGLCYKVLDTVL